MFLKNMFFCQKMIFYYYIILLILLYYYFNIFLFFIYERKGRWPRFAKKVTFRRLFWQKFTFSGPFLVILIYFWYFCRLFIKKSSGIARNRSGVVPWAPAWPTCIGYAKDELRSPRVGRVMAIWRLFLRIFGNFSGARVLIKNISQYSRGHPSKPPILLKNISGGPSRDIF